MSSNEEIGRRRRWGIDILDSDREKLAERARVDGYGGRVSLWLEGVVHLLAERPDIRLPYPPHPRIAGYQKPNRLRRRYGGYVPRDLKVAVLEAVINADPPLTSIQGIRREIRVGLKRCNEAVNELLECGELVKIGRRFQVVQAKKISGVA